MKKILITGMTSSQASSRLNERSTTFAGLMRQTLREAGHAVTLLPAELDWTTETLAPYDSVVVGVAPLTSLSANYAYGALHALSLLWDDERLTLYVDAPQPRQIAVALRAVLTDQRALTKPVYATRRGYGHVSTSAKTRKRLLDGAAHLLNGTWPTTLYPALPWKMEDFDVADALPGKSYPVDLRGINLDAYLLDRPRREDAVERHNCWVADLPGSPWVRSTAATLQYDVEPMKEHKGWTDAQVETQLAHALGAMVPPHKPGGTWWTPRYAQALHAGTPVATDWSEARQLDASWDKLAATIEEMSAQERLACATRQLETYTDNIPTRAEGADALQDALRLTEGINA